MVGSTSRLFASGAASAATNGVALGWIATAALVASSNSVELSDELPLSPSAADPTKKLSATLLDAPEIAANSGE